MKELRNGLNHLAKFQLTVNHWAYFYINVTQQNWLQFQLMRTGPQLPNGSMSDGSVVLYIKHQALPSQVTYTRTSGSTWSFQEIVLQVRLLPPFLLAYLT